MYFQTVFSSTTFFLINRYLYSQVLISCFSTLLYPKNTCTCIFRSLVYSRFMIFPFSRFSLSLSFLGLTVLKWQFFWLKIIPVSCSILEFFHYKISLHIPKCIPIPCSLYLFQDGISIKLFCRFPELILAYSNVPPRTSLGEYKIVKEPTLLSPPPPPYFGSKRYNVSPKAQQSLKWKALLMKASI